MTHRCTTLNNKTTRASKQPLQGTAAHQHAKHRCDTSTFLHVYIHTGLGAGAATFMRWRHQAPLAILMISIPRLLQNCHCYCYPRVQWLHHVLPLLWLARGVLKCCTTTYRPVALTLVALCLSTWTTATRAVPCIGWKTVGIWHVFHSACDVNCKAVGRLGIGQVELRGHLVHRSAYIALGGHSRYSLDVTPLASRQAALHEA